MVKFAIKKFVTRTFDGTDLDATTAVFHTLRSLGIKAIASATVTSSAKSLVFQDDAKKRNNFWLTSTKWRPLKTKKKWNQSIGYTLNILWIIRQFSTEKPRCRLRPTGRFHRLLGRMVLHPKLRCTIQAKCITEKGSRRNYEGPIKGRSRPDGSDADAQPWNRSIISIDPDFLILLQK